MGDENTERLVRLETAFEHMQHDITGIKSTQAGMMATQNEIKATQTVIMAAQDDIKAMLGQLLPMLIKFTGDVSEIKGRMLDMPTARDFGRLEGRVGEMSERLPTTIGYTPPRSAAG